MQPARAGPLPLTSKCDSSLVASHGGRSEENGSYGARGDWAGTASEFTRRARREPRRPRRERRYGPAPNPFCTQRSTPGGAAGGVRHGTMAGGVQYQIFRPSTRRGRHGSRRARRVNSYVVPARPAVAPCDSFPLRPPCDRVICGWLVTESEGCLVVPAVFKTAVDPLWCGSGRFDSCPLRRQAGLPGNTSDGQ